MRTFGPIKKEKFSDNNNVTTENIIGNNISPLTGLQNEKFSLVVKLKEGVVEENIIQDCSKCDDNFVLPDTNIEYLSNHVDEDRPNFRKSTVIENFVPESYGLSFKEDYLPILNNSSFFVIEDVVVNWKSLEDEISELFFPESNDLPPPVTETPTSSEGFYVVTEKRIRLFIVDCCDVSYEVIDVTLEALQRSENSSLDNDLYETSYEIFSEEQNIEDIEIDVVLPDFLPDPVVSRIQEQVFESYSISFNGISIAEDPTGSVAANSDIPSYEGGPTPNQLLSILNDGFTVEATGSLSTGGINLSGTQPLPNNGRIDFSGLIQENGATFNVSVINNGIPVSTGGPLTTQVVGISFFTSENINSQNLTLSKNGIVSGYLGFVFDAESATTNIVSINQPEEEVKRQTLTRIAQDYAQLYDGAITNTLFNTNAFKLQFDKNYSNKRLREVIGDLATDDRIEYVDTANYVSSISVSFANPRTNRINQGAAGIDMPRVGAVPSLRPMTLTSSQQNPATTYLWHLDRINQRNLPLDRNISNYPTGSNAVVYVFDTGVDINHPEFEGRARFGFSAYGPGDVYGHGTHVAGTIAGKNVGIAKKAQIVSVKVLSDTGSGTLGSILDGIDWAIEDIKQQKRIDPTKIFIANFSLGFGVAIRYVDIFIEKLAEYAEVVCSAGNSMSGPYGGNGGPGSPASSWGASAIGATAGGQSNRPDPILNDWGQPADSYAWFTNYGPKVVLYAPGISIFSCLPNNRYRYWSGTSMSAPLAAGALAIDPYIFTNSTQGVLQCRSVGREPLCRTMSMMMTKFDQRGGMLPPMPYSGQWNNLLFADGTINPPS
jgi:subtilisin family serine protease